MDGRAEELHQGRSEELGGVVPSGVCGEEAEAGEMGSEDGREVVGGEVWAD